MRVHVEFLGVLADLAGGRERTLDLPPGSSVAALLEVVQPAWQGSELRPICFVDGTEIEAVGGAETPLHEGAEVLLFLPMAGGLGVRSPDTA